MRPTFLMSLLCAVAATSFGFVAQAQVAAPPGEPVEDPPCLTVLPIEVTVRGVRERAFNAPAAITELSADDLVAVRQVDDIVARVPGLSMINDQDPGTNIIALRGVTTDRLQQAAIAFVVDGVPLADTELFTLPLYDLRKASVLRGPQGALFGKGAAGGVISLDSAEAGFGPDFVEFALGDGGLRVGTAAANVALSEHWLARVAGQWRAADGWITNRTLNQLVDAEESRSVRLRATGPIGDIEADFSIYWMRDDGGAAWASSGDVTGDFGGVLDGAALTDPIGDYAGRSKRRAVRGQGRFEARVFGGEARLLLAADDYAKRWDEELDYRPGALTFFGAPAFPNGLQPISQPIDVASQTLDASWAGRIATGLTLRAGVFAQDVERRRTDDFGPLLFGASPAAYRTDSLQTAAYAGLFFKGVGPFDFEAQGRFDRDKRTQLITDAATGSVRARDTATFERFQPRVAALYGFGGPAQGGNLFAAYGEGFRTGGFNPAPAAGSIWQARFDPEVTRSLEAGGRLRADRLRLSASIFRSEISDYQNYTFLDGQSVTLNVDAVTVEGLEVEASWDEFARFGEAALSVEGAFALADSEIDRFIAPDPLVPGAVRDYSGNQVPNAPLWTGRIAARLQGNVGGFDLYAQTVLNGAGQTVYELDNVLRSPARTWWDGEIGVGRWPVYLTLYANNLTDERWAISAFGQGMLPLLAGLGPGGPFDTFTLNRGRQVGVRLRQEF